MSFSLPNCNACSQPCATTDPTTSSGRCVQGCRLAVQQPVIFGDRLPHIGAFGRATTIRNAPPRKSFCAKASLCLLMLALLSSSPLDCTLSWCAIPEQLLLHRLMISVRNHLIHFSCLHRARCSQSCGIAHMFRLS